MAISDTDRAELTVGLAELGKRCDSLKTNPLWPDVEVLRKAVAWALTDNNIYSARELAGAKELLKEGIARAESLTQGKAPWTTQTGLVVRGYISKLDGSVQPYGLVVPDDAFDGKAHRLDLFLHGRGENLTELSFLDQRRRSPGEFTPPSTLVLHPYGRFCNANHLAGEVDVFEAIESVQKHYKIDNDRIIVRGFSMGGASTWHLAVHHADFWCAAAPGAGFSETPRFVNITAPQPDYITQLWRLYDATDWAVNLAQLPTVVYSGEIDGQRQAAVMMENALKAEGLPMTHIIGPGAGHFYHKDSKPLIDQALAKVAEKGRQKYPLNIRFTTWTLRYNRQNWVMVEGLEKHWERARVEAERDSGDSRVTITTQGVTALSLHGPTSPRSVSIDGQNPGPGDRYYKDANGQWHIGELKGQRKRHGLQGPIDDAFMERFVFVRPTGKPLSETLGKWTQNALQTAQQDWHIFFRGDAVTVDDTKLTKEQLQNANIVLFGDPSSNAVLKRLLGKLPIQWSAKGLSVAGKTYALDQAAPVLIFPNPLNPNRYVVLNSGYTWHDYNAGNNALHTPKLPDWAVLPLAGGAPLAAGFFDERWKF